MSVDIKKFKESNTDSSSFTENKVVFSSGGQDLPEPIGLQLIPIHNAVEDSFFSILDQRYRCKNLAQRRDNVKRILREYPEISGVAEPQHSDLAFARSIRRSRGLIFSRKDRAFDSKKFFQKHITSGDMLLVLYNTYIFFAFCP